jgi:hypothetical protein
LIHRQGGQEAAGLSQNSEFRAGYLGFSIIQSNPGVTFVEAALLQIA